jgi:hypothetical protein
LDFCFCFCLVLVLVEVEFLTRCCWLSSCMVLFFYRRPLLMQWSFAAAGCCF